MRKSPDTTTFQQAPGKILGMTFQEASGYLRSRGFPSVVARANGRDLEVSSDVIQLHVDQGSVVGTRLEDKSWGEWPE